MLYDKNIFYHSSYTCKLSCLHLQPGGILGRREMTIQHPTTRESNSAADRHHWSSRFPSALHHCFALQLRRRKPIEKSDTNGPTRASILKAA